MTRINPNNVDPFMFFGTYELEREAIDMTAQLLNHPAVSGGFSRDGNERSDVAGWFLSGGTEAINQATWIFRNKYFYYRMRQAAPLKVLKDSDRLFREILNLRTQGWFGIAQEWNRYNDSATKVPIPKILASFRSHFAVDKAADLLGFGQRNVEYVFGDATGHPTPDSLYRTITRVQDAGDEVAMVWLTMGDTEFGRLPDIAELGSAVGEAYRKKEPPQGDPDEFRVPVLIDAAAQWLFAALGDWIREESNGRRRPLPRTGTADEFAKGWAFDVDQVQAVVCDVHKQPVPYPASILILRDPKDIRYTMMHEAYLHLKDADRTEYLDEREMEFAQTHATIPTTRPGYGAAATWAYFAGLGIRGLIESKRAIWELVKRLRDAIVNGPLTGAYELLCEPESAIVAFTLRGKWIEKHAEGLRRMIARDSFAYRADQERHLEQLVGWANERIMRWINHDPRHSLFIATSEKLRICNRKQFNIYRAKVAAAGHDEVVTDYSGLIVHIMEHNSCRAVDKLVRELERMSNQLLRCAREEMRDSGTAERGSDE